MAPAPASGHRAAVRPGATLADRFDPRSNSLTLLRLLLAVTVAFTHTLQLARGYQPVLGGTLLGDLAVDAFFVLSGFLVTRSWLRLGSLRRYLWHRFLRIMPAFWLCLVLTALVVAPLTALLAGAPPLGVLTAAQDPAWRYVAANAALLMRQFGIGGLPADVPGDGIVNGALWTLAYEAACYCAVAVLGVLGVLRRSPGLVLAGTGLLWAATAAAALGHPLVAQELLLRLLFLFLLGALGHLYADRVPVSGALAGTSAVVVAISLAVLPDYRALGAPAFAYLCLWAVVALPLRRDPGWDLSYGIYIFHWPLLVLLLSAGLGSLPVVVVVAVALGATALLAALSWRFVERPALARKDAPWVTRVRLPRQARRAG